MARFFLTPRGASAFGAIIAMATGLAIVAFSAPPVILVPVSWATGIGCMALKERIVRHLGP